MIQAYWSTGHGFLAVFSYFSRSRSTNWMQWSTIFSTPKRPQSFLFLNGPRKLAAAMATPYQRQWHQLRRRRGCAKYKLLPGEESLSLSLFLVHSLAGTGAPQLEPFLEPSSGSLGRHFAVNLAPRPLLSAPAARAAPAEAAALTLVWWLFCSPSSSVFTWFYRLFTCPFFCWFVCLFVFLLTSGLSCLWLITPFLCCLFHLPHSFNEYRVTRKKKKKHRDEKNPVFFLRFCIRSKMLHLFFPSSAILGL